MNGRFDHSLQSLQMRHPILRAQLETHKLKLQWADDAPPIPWKRQRISHETNVWDIALELARSVRADDYPLARVSVVDLEESHCTWVLISVAHVIADAFTLATFVRDLISIYNGKSSGLPPAPPYMSTPMPAPPSLKNRVFFLRQMGTKLVAKSSGICHAKSSQDQMAACELSSIFTSLLVARCKRENTTVYGALMAALLQSNLLQKHCFERDRTGLSAREIKVLTPVDMRRHAEGLSHNAIGSHVAATVSFWPTMASNKKGFWSLAQSSRTRLCQALDQHEHTDILHHMKMQQRALQALGGRFRYNHWLHRSTVECNSMGRVRMSAVDAEHANHFISPTCYFDEQTDLQLQSLGWAIGDNPDRPQCGQVQIYSLTLEETGRLHIMCHLRSDDDDLPRQILAEMAHSLAAACNAQLRAVKKASKCQAIQHFHVDPLVSDANARAHLAGSRSDQSEVKRNSSFCSSMLRPPLRLPITALRRLTSTSQFSVAVPPPPTYACNAC